MMRVFLGLEPGGAVVTDLSRMHLRTLATSSDKVRLGSRFPEG
jgi:hypothetical protein